MIYSLRKKFIVITAVSVGVVFALIFGGIYYSSRLQLDRSMDLLADIIVMNDGDFQGNQQIPPETQFSTRFFTVRIDESGQILQENTEHISSVSGDKAKAYVQKALDKETDRGWISAYRYKIAETDYGRLVVFVNGETNRDMMNQLLYSVLFVLSGSFLLILFLIILISKKVVKPSAESYEKQKQFVTDVNHELKTPLTLILSNIDIVESEIGRNEWLDDIRSEGERMGALINQLVDLSRMDEDGDNFVEVEFDLSEVVTDTVSEFRGLAAEREKSLTAEIKEQVRYRGDEGMIRRLLCILLDNAVQYCDPGGNIRLTLSVRGRCPVIRVENPYKNVKNEEIEKFFDRFYRADRARTFTGGFGIGLSIARKIARNHRGDISVYQKGSGHIGFKVILK